VPEALEHLSWWPSSIAWRGSLPDAREILDDLTKREVKLSLGGSVHDPTDPVGRLLFNVLAMVAEFEADLIRLRTREGMKLAKAKGRLRGKQPKLNPRQEAHLVALHRAGEHSTAELGDLVGVARSTVYRAIARRGTATSRATRRWLNEHRSPIADA
jgi:DNA invertase Pin-like site-specific DNA recombinase